ncbi:hypothetical protein PSNVIR_03327 [Pseudomonas sp. Nvir]|nr:hypothetical protein PSNVIR_03327 [Pseudomonas sp. Nvir]
MCFTQYPLRQKSLVLRSENSSGKASVSLLWLDSWVSAGRRLADI